MKSGSCASHVLTTFRRMRVIASGVRLLSGAFLFAASVVLSTHSSWADGGRVSVWLPGLYGSLAAVPGQPRFSFATFNYYTSVSAGADVSRGREFQLGRFSPSLSVNLNANL